MALGSNPTYREEMAIGGGVSEGGSQLEADGTIDTAGTYKKDGNALASTHLSDTAQLVRTTDFDAQTVLAATADNTPAALTVTEQTIVGRKTGGNVAALTATEVRTLINVEDGADVTDATNVNAAGAVMEGDLTARTIYGRTKSGSAGALSQDETIEVIRIGGDMRPPVPTGLIRMWHMDSATTINDYSGQEDDATVGGSGTTTCRAIGTALEFNGSGYASAGTTLAANYGAQSLSYSAWFKTSTSGSYMGICGWYSSDPEVCAVRLTNTGTIQFQIYNGGADNAVSSATFDDGEWHHMCAVRNYGGTNYIYVDGVQVATIADTSRDATDPATNFMIGAWTTSLYRFSGCIDEVCVWNRALSANEAKTLYEAGRMLLSHNQTLTAGTTAGAVAQRFGASNTEGLETTVIDETVATTSGVSVALTTSVPDGAVILSAQANIESAITGNDDNDNALAAVGIGISGDVDAYGESADLSQNTKIDTIPDFAVNSGAVALSVYGTDGAGNAVTETFAGGSVRIRVVYLACNSLDDA